jgi:hypothetical protein
VGAWHVGLAAKQRALALESAGAVWTLESRASPAEPVQSQSRASPDSDGLWSALPLSGDPAAPRKGLASHMHQPAPMQLTSRLPGSLGRLGKAAGLRLGLALRLLQNSHDVPVDCLVAWEKEGLVLSARGFKRVGRHSEYAYSNGIDGGA